MTKLVIATLPHYAGLPVPMYAREGDAGFDLRAAIGDARWELQPGKRMLVPTGLMMSIQPGYEVQVRPKSGLALNYGITVLNAPGTIDSNYRGEVGVILHNASQEPFSILQGSRIAQAVLCPALRAEFVFCDPCDLGGTGRGAGGFGSTGLA